MAWVQQLVPAKSGDQYPVCLLANYPATRSDGCGVHTLSALQVVCVIRRCLGRTSCVVPCPVLHKTTCAKFPRELSMTHHDIIQKFRARNFTYLHHLRQSGPWTKRCFDQRRRRCNGLTKKPIEVPSTNCIMLDEAVIIQMLKPATAKASKSIHSKYLFRTYSQNSIQPHIWTWCGTY